MEARGEGVGEGTTDLKGEDNAASDGSGSAKRKAGDHEKRDAPSKKVKSDGEDENDEDDDS